MKGPGLCSGVSRSLVGQDRPEEGGQGGGVRFYKSQCKSRDKYYLLFEERHSRYLLYRGKGPVLSGTQVRARSKKNLSSEATG